MFITRVVRIKNTIYFLSEIWDIPGQELGAGCWKPMLLGQAWPRKVCRAPGGRKPCRNPGYARRRREMPLAALPQPWVYRSSHSSAPFQAVMGQARIRVLQVHKNRTSGFSGWKGPAEQAPLNSFPPWLLSTHRPDTFFKEPSRLTPPCIALWMPLL